MPKEILKRNYLEISKLIQNFFGNMLIKSNTKTRNKVSNLKNSDGILSETDSEKRVY